MQFGRWWLPWSKAASPHLTAAFCSFGEKDLLHLLLSLPAATMNLFDLLQQLLLYSYVSMIHYYGKTA